VTGIDSPQVIGDGAVGEPVGPVVLADVHRQPVALAHLFVPVTVTGIVDQEVE
jgi:hypothetical protein